MPLKEEFITYNSQEQGAHCTMQDHVGKNQSWLGGQKMEGTLWGKNVFYYSGGKFLGGDVSY